MDLKQYIGLLVGQQQTPEQIRRQLVTTPAADRYLDQCINAAITAHLPKVTAPAAAAVALSKGSQPTHPGGVNGRGAWVISR